MGIQITVCIQDPDADHQNILYLVLQRRYEGWKWANKPLNDKVLVVIGIAIWIQHPDPGDIPKQIYNCICKCCTTVALVAQHMGK